MSSYSSAVMKTLEKFGPADFSELQKNMGKLYDTKGLNPAWAIRLLESLEALKHKKLIQEGKDGKYQVSR